MQDSIFFIALLPDAEIQEEVTAFKEDCRMLFQASHAFKSPPHITLISPFRWPLDRLEELRLALVDFAFDQWSFSIRLDGFNRFAPRVIYVDVEKNPTLNQLQEDLSIQLAEQLQLKVSRDHGFTPHMTIAHKDLKAAVFDKAFSYFSKKTYLRQFLAEDLVLLRHDQKKWIIAERFNFG